ncbi:MAG: hypothetical protein R2991_01845 [Thermoanaerobaculia bacterium]
MRTVVDLPGPLLERARKRARRDGVTLEQLLVVLLQREIEKRERQAEAPSRLDELVVCGHGVASEVREGDWFDLIYPLAG